MKKCLNCSIDCDDNAKFCVQCGYKFEEPTTPQQEESPFLTPISQSGYPSYVEQEPVQDYFSSQPVQEQYQQQGYYEPQPCQTTIRPKGKLLIILVIILPIITILIGALLGWFINDKYTYSHAEYTAVVNELKCIKEEFEPSEALKIVSAELSGLMPNIAFEESMLNGDVKILKISAHSSFGDLDGNVSSIDSYTFGDKLADEILKDYFDYNLVYFDYYVTKIGKAYSIEFNCSTGTTRLWKVID